MQYVIGPRKRRGLPSMDDICRYHGIPKACVRCGHDRVLERAHVIDHAGGGLDLVHNIRPLCPTCHRCQPEFSNGDEELALEWFKPEDESYYEGMLLSRWAERLRRLMILQPGIVDELGRLIDRGDVARAHSLAMQVGVF